MVPASGNFYPCFHIANVQQTDPNTIETVYTFSIDSAVTGTFTGSLVLTERDVIHPDGSITFDGSAIFVSAYSCGTLVFSYTGKGNVNTHQESGHFVGSQGTGCLAGIYSVGTFEGVLGAVRGGCDDAGDNVSYNGQYLFAP